MSPILDFAPATEEDLATTGREVEAAGGRWLALIADQRQIKELRRAAEKIEKQRGGVDIVFANAGIQAFKPLLEMEEADWHDQIDVNRQTQLVQQPRGVTFLAQSSTKRWRESGPIDSKV